MTSAIYKIENLTNGKIYIGQSKNAEKRIRRHRNNLKRGDHYNDHLQRSWDKYGEKSFVFKIIKPCPKLFLDPFEKLFIKNYNTVDSKYGYNKESGGHENKEFHEETMEKISGENSANWKDYPRIIKRGFEKNGKQRYALVVDGEWVCSSSDLNLLEEKLDNNDFSPIYTDEPHIMKAGFRNGKQNYAIVKNSKRICCSVNLEKLEEKLKIIKNKQKGDDINAI